MTELESAERDAVAALISTVAEWASKNSPPFGTMPEGIRLEMHPSVRHAIVRNWLPRYSEFTSGQELPTPPQIPVHVTTDLPRDAWRLVVVKEDVITGGTVPG